MFVQSMTLVDHDNKYRVGVAVDMGVSTARVYISPEDREGDKWRGPQQVVPNNTLDVDPSMRSVETILSTAMIYRKEVSEQFVKYK